MKHVPTLIAGIIAAGVIGTTAISESHADKATLSAVKARQSLMSLQAFNIGLLGGMAKGDVEYNAEAATAAATNLAALAAMDQSRMWPPGSDNAALGDDVTEALPAIWAADSKIGDDAMALVEATAAMQSAADDGLDALRGAIGPVGKACGACHENYRKAND